MYQTFQRLYIMLYFATFYPFSTDDLSFPQVDRKKTNAYLTRVNKRSETNLRRDIKETGVLPKIMAASVDG